MVPISDLSFGGPALRRSVRNKALRQQGATPRARSRGFTLMEVCIGVAILALAAAVVLPAMNNATRADLRKATGGVSTTVRAAYDNAALSGDTYRLVFTPGKHEIKVESVEEALSFDERTGAFVAASQLAAERDGYGQFPGDANAVKEEPAKPTAPEGDSQEPGALSALLSMSKLARRSASTAFTPQGKYVLPNSVNILSVWTDGRDDVVSEGDAYLYFFPGGYTQDALIHLEDSDKRVYTVKVHALTGRCETFDHFVEKTR